MLDVIVFIASVGPIVNKGSLLETIYSISKNIGECNYKFYIVIDNEGMKKFTEQIFDNEKLRHVIKENSLLEVVYTKGPWATDYNDFFEAYKNTTEYILVSHDDLTINTPNFFRKTLKEIEGKEDEVSWITYTNDHYYKRTSGIMPNSIITGFHTDAGNYPLVFECHNFKEGEYLTEDNEDLLDYPDRAVKCHGIFIIPGLISVKSMEKIGPCANFGPYTMLINEDWSLESLKNNLFSIWVPDIFITHPNPKYPRNTDFDLRFEAESHRLFYEKWGFFAHKDYVKPEKREQILEKYKDTSIPWSASRKTYEWDYLKDE